MDRLELIDNKDMLSKYGEKSMNMEIEIIIKIKEKRGYNRVSVLER